jgi:hypothetical protein
MYLHVHVFPSPSLTLIGLQLCKKTNSVVRELDPEVSAIYLFATRYLDIQCTQYPT